MKFPISSILLVIIGGLCFAIFIIFNYAYQNPDTGIFVLLTEKANATMNSGMATWFYNIRQHVGTGFGMTGVAMFGLAFFIYIIDSVSNPGSDY